MHSPLPVRVIQTGLVQGVEDQSTGQGRDDWVSCARYIFLLFDRRVRERRKHASLWLKLESGCGCAGGYPQGLVAEADGFSSLRVLLI
ncbi:hypothetical protein F4Z98_03295 [Candidatus Poribacteria bacterium]|nr:hypothetical protein [Candidatus Poribacteria bacterium]MYA99388.1 hypothetical protein [Candidatus Poribacteria bacterium]